MQFVIIYLLLLFNEINDTVCRVYKLDLLMAPPGLQELFIHNQYTRWCTVILQQQGSG